MPEISRFFGIIVRMHYDDHPPPHVHVEYQGRRAKVDFDGNVLLGDLGSRTALRLVREWIDAHAGELARDWDLARAGRPLERIAPLEYSRFMWKMSEIRRAEHVRDHIVRIEFDDGTRGDVDLSPYLDRGPIFEPLADESFFRGFAVEGGTLTWPNGADIAPERLYEMTIAANQPVGRTALP